MKAVPKKLYRALKGRIRPDSRNKVIKLSPGVKPRGYVLVSYVIESFITDPDDPVFRSHSHYWETRQMVNTFLELGYSVDLISYLNTSFKPNRRYDYFVGARTNFDRLSRLLDDSCKKVVHLDTAHWITSNYNAHCRLYNLLHRRNVALEGSLRMIEQNKAIENADLATILGNTFTIESYSYANKPIYRIPITSTIEFEWKEREVDAVRNSYLWFGSSGFLHKGLDLVLEVFAGMPEFRLFVCGPFNKEHSFLKEYHHELFESENIVPVGWVDVNGSEFTDVLDQCIGIVYPSCAEGGGGSVISCMHAGVIPVVSREASVDVGDNGVTLAENTISEMRGTVSRLSQLSAKELEEMSRDTWQFASTVHSKTAFAGNYKDFVLNVLL